MVHTFGMVFVDLLTMFIVFSMVSLVGWAGVDWPGLGLGWAAQELVCHGGNA